MCVKCYDNAVHRFYIRLCRRDSDLTRINHLSRWDYGEVNIQFDEPEACCIISIDLAENWNKKGSLKRKGFRKLL
jgi:hypothetical protein